MKHFIQVFKQEQTNLLNQISAGNLQVSSVNGIPCAEHGISFSEAQEIIKNQKAYLKESGQFKGDTTKVVVSKNLFTKFLELNHDLNLFFLSRLDKDATTSLTMEREKAKIIENIKRFAKIDQSNFLKGVFFLGISAVCFLVYYFVPELRGFGIILLFISFVIFAFLLIFLVLFILNNIEYKKAKKEKDTIQGKDFFLYGHDADDTRGVKKYKRYNIMSFSFPNMPDYQRMITTAISLNGKIGYIIRKDTPVDIDFNAHHLNCRGPVVPCIILNESILFDVAYLQVMDGWIFGETPSPLDMMTRPKDALNESKNWIQSFDLEPRMFI